MKTIERLSLEYSLNTVDATELHTLIEEVCNEGFEHSSSLSNYIRSNKLGCKYPNISGLVKMEKNTDSWVFEGGFPPRIYSIVCIELKLKNQKSGARATGFTAYKDL